MENKTKQLDEHRFGVGDFLSATEYPVGETITVKVVEFLGRQDYTDRMGEQKRAGMYKVIESNTNVPQDFRLGIQNEKLLAKKYGIRSYEELIGKTLSLKVKAFNLGNGFVIVGVK